MSIPYGTLWAGRATTTRPCVYFSRTHRSSTQSAFAKEFCVPWPHLVELYESDTLGLPPQIDYLTAGVLSAAADDTVIDDVIRLASDPNAGFKRVLLLFALKKSRNPRAKMLLNELRSDPVIGKEVKRMRRLERLQGKM